jgi:hypothetical protein
MGETKKGKGFWLSLATLLSVSSGKPPELDQPCLADRDRGGTHKKSL